MKKMDGRENITTIIHDLKTAYTKAFGEKFPTNDKKMEEILIKAAREVKKRKGVVWFLDKEGNKKIKIFKDSRFF